MKKLVPTVLILLLSIVAEAQETTPKIGPGFGAYTEDPRKILNAAAKAAAAVRTLRYNARYAGVGAMATRAPAASGVVTIARLAADNPLRARLAAKGIYSPASVGDANAFHTTFDGSTIRRLRSKEKTVVVKAISDDDPRERSLGYVTSHFGGGPYQLLTLEYLLDTPFDKQIKAATADYEGRTSIEGVQCHVVYIETAPDTRGRVARERWFIGVKDSLPRRHEVLVADNDGRFGAYVLTISNLEANRSLPANSFSLRTPAGYVSKQMQETPKPPPLTVGEAAPDWRLSDAVGKEHSLADYRDRIVVIDFWATWCGPCIRAMPELQRVYDRFRDRGVEVFGVNVWEDSNAAEFMKRNGYTYGLLLRGENAADAYRVPSLPTLYVIGKDGKIIRATKGLDDGLEKFLESVLRE